MSFPLVWAGWCFDTSGTGIQGRVIPSVWLPPPKWGMYHRKCLFYLPFLHP
jgi:hypothetical protein